MELPSKSEAGSCLTMTLPGAVGAAAPELKSVAVLIAPGFEASTELKIASKVAT